MISESVIRDNLDNTLEETNFSGLGKPERGKVRDNYIMGDKRIIVTTDKISAFDVILGTIPFKGQVLNQMAEFWFEKTKEIVGNSMISVPDPNVMIMKQCKALPVEMVIRSYLTGVTKTSAWYNYSNGVRNFCGNLLQDGMRKDQKFEKPISTPSTRGEMDGHDESVSAEEIVKRGLVTKNIMDELTSVSFRLFDLGTRIAAQQGIILVDTKYEFGLDENGGIVLIDEIHTPDSSRFWFTNRYEEMFGQGKEQIKIDKEYVRTWMSEQGFIGEGKPPELTDDVRVEAAKRYIQAYEFITGKTFEVTDENVMERIKRNLEEVRM